MRALLDPFGNRFTEPQWLDGNGRVRDPRQQAEVYITWSKYEEVGWDSLQGLIPITVVP